MPRPHRRSLLVGVALLLATALGMPGTAALTTSATGPAAAAGTGPAPLVLPDRLSLLAGATPTVTPAPGVPASGTETALPAPVRAAAPAAASRSVTRTAPTTAPSTVRPNDGPVSSGFGRRWGTQHDGLDFAGGYGSTIRTAQAGTVTFAGSASGYGNLVVVRHADGFSTAYGHMSVITVSQGEQVDAGERIAKVGNEGRSTGPHLHFEVRVGNEKIDPAPWLRERGVRL